MTSTWLDSSESEFEDYGDDYGDDYPDDYGEATREQQRRARVALAQRRRAAAASRRRPTDPARLPGRPVARAAAVRNLELETKVAEDRLRDQLKALRDQAQWNAWAGAASIAVNAGVKALGGPENRYLQAITLASPLALYRVHHKRPGIEGYFSDPRVIGLGAVLALTFAGDRLNAPADVTSIVIKAPTRLEPGESAILVAQPQDRRGNLVTSTVTFKVDPAKATILPLGPNKATITANQDALGQALVTATADGFEDYAYIDIRWADEGLVGLQSSAPGPEIPETGPRTASRATGAIAKKAAKKP